jgi:cyclopropane fatty-acyl-phospholipid synthase-like methyltransferase
VQTPEVEIALFERIFRQRFRREPQSLREDFCGTALLCRHWVESDPDRIACGVDADPEVLRAAEAMNVRPLDEDEAERIVLIRADARTLSERTYDAITAGNYSWALFDDDALASYLAAVHACLEDEGLVALEIFGGADLRRPLLHQHREPGFTYLWEQKRYDPDARTLDAAIHFRLDDGRELREAFGYRFQVRDYEETAAALRAAGFADASLYVEEDGGGFVRSRREPERAIWSGYVIGCRHG